MAKQSVDKKLSTDRLKILSKYYPYIRIGICHRPCTIYCETIIKFYVNLEHSALRVSFKCMNSKDIKQVQNCIIILLISWGWSLSRPIQVFL